MSETKFLPDHWEDDINPPLQPSPDAFIRKTAEGFQLYPVGWNVEDEQRSFYIEPLEHGDVIWFIEHRHHGLYTLDIADDGAFDASLEIPAEANCFMLKGDLERDTLSSSLQGLVENLVENDAVERGGSCEIEAYYWSDEGIPYRFFIEGDSAHFEKVTEQ